MVGHGGRFSRRLSMSKARGERGGGRPRKHIAVSHFIYYLLALLGCARMSLGECLLKKFDFEFLADCVSMEAGNLERCEAIG